MRLLVRTSRWAVWARRLGSFALPLAIIPVLMHRGSAIGTDTFEIVEAGDDPRGARPALITSIIAFVRIWITGDEGWGRAITGLIFSLACFIPSVCLPPTTSVIRLWTRSRPNSANPPLHDVRPRADAGSCGRRSV